ncbi:hypothetical protein NPIL_131061 [Nephila pilipes]|uniref:Uncharacterized protein n=1 Tax=Nephila pilipes TaxID=299642 RepID=A0A8X6PP29_NEPPI|nr:hypothetical protein NPIL_131061 [Nephila pilipes]
MESVIKQKSLLTRKLMRLYAIMVNYLQHERCFVPKGKNGILTAAIRETFFYRLTIPRRESCGECVNLKEVSERKEERGE